MSDPVVATPQAVAAPTSPQPIAARQTDTSYMPDTSAEPVPIIFKDGTQGFVPRGKVMDLVSSGDGEVAHHMSFPDGTQGFIPHNNLAGALQDGGKVLDADHVRQQVANTPHEPTLSDYAELGLDTALMTLGSAPAKEAAGVAQAAVAGKIPGGIKQLYQIVKSTWAGEEVAGSEVAAKGFKEFADVAYQKAAEAIQAGESLKAKAYTTVAAAGKGYSHLETAWAWVGKTFPGVPFGMKLALTAQAVKEGWDFATGSGGDKDDARDTLFGK